MLGTFDAVMETYAILKGCSLMIKESKIATKKNKALDDTSIRLSAHMEVPSVIQVVTTAFTRTQSATKQSDV